MPSSVKEKGEESAVVKEKSEESTESFKTAPGDVDQKSEVKAPANDNDGEKADNKEEPRLGGRQRGGRRRRYNKNRYNKNDDRRRDNLPLDNNDNDRRRDNLPRDNNDNGGGRRRNNFSRRGNRNGGARRQRNFTNEGVGSADRQVLARGLKGFVNWYSVRECYGFITRSDRDEDVFVHQMNITKSHMYQLRYRSLADGEEVEFDLAEGRNGRTEAINVTGPNGKNVIGTSIIVRHGRYGPQVIGVDEDTFSYRQNPQYTRERRERNNRRRDARKEGDDQKDSVDPVATQTSTSDTKLSAAETSSSINEKENAQPASSKVESESVQTRMAKWNGPNGGGKGAADATKTNNKNGTAAGDGIEVKTSNPAAGNGASEVQNKNEAEA